MAIILAVNIISSFTSMYSIPLNYNRIKTLNHLKTTRTQVKLIINGCNFYFPWQESVVSNMHYLIPITQLLLNSLRCY